MNDELREVMCQALTRHWHGPDADMYDLEGECECLEEAGVMLAAIEQAGYRIVSQDEWAEVIEMAATMQRCADHAIQRGWLHE